MTKLIRLFEKLDEGDDCLIYSRDSWLIPEEGTEIWCTAWSRGQIIKPYGDENHIIVGLTIYHCDKFMKILIQREKEGFIWGIEGVLPVREQQIDGRWIPVETE